MDAVAKAALVSKLTIYSHFADKKALFEAVIERKSTQTIAEGYLRFAELPVMEALEEVGINYCNLILNEDAVKWLRMMYVESARDPTSARVYYAVGPQRIKQALIELLRAWAKMNQLNIDDYEAACEQYFSLMRGGVLQKALLGIEKLPTPAYLKKHVKAGVRLFLNTYGFK